MTAALAPATSLDVADWQARRRAHEERVDAWLAPHLARRRTGVKHPVEDVLFRTVKITNNLRLRANPTTRGQWVP